MILKNLSYLRNIFTISLFLYFHSKNDIVQKHHFLNDISIMSFSQLKTNGFYSNLVYYLFVFMFIAQKTRFDEQGLILLFKSEFYRSDYFY
jgi:hypothetical protein